MNAPGRQSKESSPARQPGSLAARKANREKSETEIQAGRAKNKKINKITKIVTDQKQKPDKKTKQHKARKKKQNKKQKKTKTVMGKITSEEGSGGRGRAKKANPSPHFPQILRGKSMAQKCAKSLAFDFCYCPAKVKGMRRGKYSF